MKNKIQNNIVIELHVPDFTPVKEFYSKLGFVIISEDRKAEQPGYLVMQRKDMLGNTMINFYGDDERVYNQSYFKRFDKETQRGYAVGITIPVGNIDDLYQAVSESLKDHIV
jgi:hypothetical protein